MRVVRGEVLFEEARDAPASSLSSENCNYESLVSTWHLPYSYRLTETRELETSAIHS